MYEYDFHTYSVRRKSSQKKRFFLLLVFGLILFFGFRFFLPSDSSEESLEKAVIGESTQQQLPDPMTTLSNPLKGIVEETLSGSRGTYAVVIENTSTQEIYRGSEHHIFDAASLYKLWVMAVVYQQIEKGTLSEDTVLTSDIAELNRRFNIASDSAELTEGTVSFTVASALKQMITISHNYAALLLAAKVRLSTVAAFLEENGLHESRVGGADSLPTTTAADVALFFNKLYKGELANPEHTEQMIALLKAQRLNNKLPLYLPESVDVAHKTGELGLVTHDAGVIYLPNGSQYLIVVLSESTYPPGAEERIAQISKNVYEYFIK